MGQIHVKVNLFRRRPVAGGYGWPHWTVGDTLRVKLGLT